MKENVIGRIVVDVAIQLHRDLGPGLLESVYEVLMADQLAEHGLAVKRQAPIAIEYQGKRFSEGFRVDLLVQDAIIVELKCVEKLHAAHKKQLLTYLRLADLKLGYLLNFGERLMKYGIVRTVNGLA
jgi:GxxExxY protein